MPEPKTVTILVVEDDDLDFKAFQRALQNIRLANPVVRAMDGEEALSVLETSSFDLILLDVLMPNEDGIGVLLKARNRGVETPIVVLTGAKMGESGPSYSQYAERLGAKKGLEKPITFDKVKEALSYA